MDRKRCASCGEDKPAAQFYKNSGHRDGLSTYCRPCTKADRHRAWRAKHPEPPPYVPPTEKACTKCGVIKPLDQFHRRRSARDGRKEDCAECAIAYALAWNKKNPEYHRQKANEYRKRHLEAVADRALRLRLGMAPGAYADMLAAQDGKCAICGTADPGARTRRFHVDHCHDSGQVRDLLCGACNIGLGAFRDKPDLLKAAAEYLLRHHK